MNFVNKINDQIIFLQDYKIQTVTLALVLIFIAVVSCEPATKPLRRHLRSESLPEAVKRRLTSVSNEDQLVKDLGDVLYHGRTAVIRFYADWCPVCSSDRPRFMELIERFPYTNFFRVDVDEHPKLSSEYGIRAVPTYFVLRRNTAHLTYHSAGDVNKYLTQLRQARLVRNRNQRHLNN